MEAISRFIVIILAAVDILLFPLQYIAMAQDETISDAVNLKTADFTDTARQQGYITLDMYEDYINDLSKTGETYKMDMIVSHPVTGKEAASEDAYTALTYSKNDITASYISTSHTHTDDCYAGTLHVCDGINCIRADGSYAVVVAATSSGLYYSFDGIHWLRCTASSDYAVGDVTYGNGRFVAVSNGYTHYSADGITWTGVSQPGLSFNEVTYGNGVFLGIAYNSGYCGIYTSADGIRWNTIMTSSSQSNYFIDATYAYGYFLVSGKDYGTLRYMYIPKGSTFGTVDTYNSISYYGSSIGIYSGDGVISAANNRFSTVDGDGNLFMGSDDYYIGWTKRLSSIYYLSVLGYGNNKYVLASGQNIYTSITGDTNTWIKDAAISTYNNFNSLIYYCGSYLLSSFGQASGPFVFSSADAKSWISTNCPAALAIASNVDGGSDLTNRGACIKIGKYYDAYGNQVYPTCNNVVTGITATNNNQTVEAGGSIVTTATATYLNGHTGEVNCSVSGFNSNSPGVQTVTLSYWGLVGNARTTGSRFCTITVTVKNNKTLSSISASPSSQTINRLGTPSFTVTAYYSDGSGKTLASSDYTISNFDSSISGEQTVIFTFTENNITKTAAAKVYVNIIKAITISPANILVPRYTQAGALPYSVTVSYLYGTNKTITSGYSIIGYNSSILGTQNITISYTENGITKTAAAQVTVKKLKTTCPICGTTYELDDSNIDQGCPYCAAKAVKLIITPSYLKIEKGNALSITVTAVYQNGKSGAVTGWTNDYDPNADGIQNVTISYQGITELMTVEHIQTQVICPVCKNAYNLNSDGTDPGCPICSKEIVRIDVAETEITVHKEQKLPITVTATYKDGHTSTITDWSTDFIAEAAGVYLVDIYYKSARDGVKVNVIDDDFIVCPICGLAYDKSKNPGGCPACSVTITGIGAALRNGGTQVIYKSQLNLDVTLIYKDTHRKTVYTGYTVNGFDSNKLGIQSVTVYYDSFSTVIAVEVINGPLKKTCPKGHVYYLNEDGSDPGCPYCSAAAAIDTTVYYFDATYHSEIILTLYTYGIFNLSPGDYFSVTLINGDKSIRAHLRKMFFHTNTGILRKRYSYGGEVT